MRKEKSFFQTLHDYNFVGIVTEDNSDKDDEMIIDVVTDSHLHGDQKLVGYSDIIGTVTERSNTDKEDEMEIPASELQPPRDERQLVSYLDSDSDREPCSSKQ